VDRVPDMIGTWRLLNKGRRDKFPLPGTDQFKVLRQEGPETPNWFVCRCMDIFGGDLGEQVLSRTYIEYNTVGEKA
jgi:hypothetical protein